jgi:hypothetical protein
MDSPLAGLLPYIFSRADALKRQLADAAQNPMGLLGQRQGQLEDATKNVAGGGLLAGSGSLERQRWSDAVDQMGPGLLGITAYHGSPHLFDKFDMSKIGTGEGAQAYGHGLYFADNPEVALNYQKALSRPPSDGLSKAEDIAAWAHSSSRGAGATDAAQVLADEIARLDHYGKFGKTLKRSDYEQALEIVRSGKAPAGGSLYKVDIPDEAVANMLHWDRPLSEQSAGVKRALSDAYPGSLEKYGDKTLQGMFPYGVNAAVSKTLRDAGIPGIRYLDQGSRGAKEGTYNTVLFDDSLPKILGRE